MFLAYLFNYYVKVSTLGFEDNIAMNNKSVIYNPGADPGFFSGGGAPLRNDVTDSELKNF